MSKECTHPNIPKFSQEDKEFLWAFRQDHERAARLLGYLDPFKMSNPFDFSNASAKCEECGENFCWTTMEEIRRTYNQLREMHKQ